MQSFPNQVTLRINDLLFRAVKEIASNNPAIEWTLEKVDNENTFVTREKWFDRMKDIINKFETPVIVSNITIYVLFDMFFKKNEEYDYKNDTYYFAGNKTFEIYYDGLLPGSLDNFIIFDANSLETATIVKYDPNMFL